MNTDRIRQLYLDFFAEKGHIQLPSASLIPQQDPTLLFTGAGMVPFKPYFLGQDTPPQRRITTCQRCLRTGDIENVGKTGRHHTFFEMLGNFSFGDYFKEEAITWAWEFSIQHLGFNPDNIWATIYLDDDEAFHIWNEQVGLPAERIVRLGKEHNFWEIGVGPCGPCSELYYDRGEGYGCGSSECAPGCDDCERYLEYWNLVFIQFHQDEKNELTPLTSKGIDTGLGLERVASLLQNVDSNFDTDILRPLIDKVSAISGIPYNEGTSAGESMRIIADHARAVTFMVYDGIIPGNEGRHYVLRRLLRRAVRHAHLLRIDEPFMAQLVDLTVDLMKTGYPTVADATSRIKQVVTAEEARFHTTIDQGIAMLDELVDELKSSGEKVLAGEAAFRLYDTYGFPLELTEEMLAKEGLALDRDGFEREMQGQRERARKARATHGYMGDAPGESSLPDLDVSVAATLFVGYDDVEAVSDVIGIYIDGEKVSEATAGQRVDVLLQQTPFYAEAGGQVADLGVLKTADGGLVRVLDVQKSGTGVIVHRGELVEGTLRAGEQVTAQVDGDRRRQVARNHTATHLLHRALRDVLGDHVQQAGSLVAPDRLRFDFSHYKAMTAEEMRAVERAVNDAVLSNLPVDTVMTTYDEAVEHGALALFGEKYGDDVRMVDIGGYSIELCGGTHVEQSAEIGLCKLTSESSVASGVRRIEAMTGEGALTYVEARTDALQGVADTLGCPPLATKDHIDQMVARMRQLEKEVERLKSRAALGEVDRLLHEATSVDGVTVVAAKVDGVDGKGLRTLGDRIVAKAEDAVVVLGSGAEGRVQLIAMVSGAAADRGVHAGKLIRHVADIVGGGGGGQARFAQAGGKDVHKLDEALTTARAHVTDALLER